MDKIVADTNFLLSQFEHGLDVPSELLRISSAPFAFIIPSVVMVELRAIAGKTGKRAAAARFALQNMEKWRARFSVQEAESSGRADDWIFKYAQKNKVAVATNDVPLRRRLLALGVPIIGVKGKSKLDYV
jgi:rRNA-processing protein FCF1